jgi:serine/threonine protein kinase
LLDTDGNLKISDFGFSTLSVGDADGDGGTRAELLHTTCGTPNYVAPEVLGKDGYDGKKADVWSVGVILYVLLAGYLPFDENTMAALFSKIKSADYEFPDWFSPEARDLIAMILVPDPNKRPRISDIKNHIWMMKGDSGPTPMPPTNHAANHGAPPNVNPVNNYGNAATHMPTTPTPPATATATVHPPAAPSTPQQQPPSSAAVAAANIQSPRPPQQQPQQSQQPAPAAAAPAVATSQSVHTEKAAAAAQPAVTTATSSHHKHQEKQTAPQVDAGCCGWASHGKKK